MKSHKSTYEKRELSYPEVQELFPTSWAALPEPYRNDTCLKFVVYSSEGYTFLSCKPKEDQVIVLGNWECIWDDEVSGKWIEDDYQTYE